MKNQESIQLFIATDLHYLSNQLMDDGPAFQRAMEYDGKLTRYSNQILKALVNRTIEQKPDGLIISGDLTFNGEKQSLLEVKDQLLKIQEHGIPVYVIAGNHDIDYANARKYAGNQSFYVPTVSTDEFKEEMKSFGYEQALSKDKDSMSYFVKVSKKLALLMIDCNTRKPRAMVSKETLRWISKQIKWAERHHIQIVSVSHQNVLPQSILLSDGFVILNHEEVAEELKDHVLVHLSGHSHLQHMASITGLTDICTECLSLYPLQYGILTIKKDKWTYTNGYLDTLQKEAEERHKVSMQNQIMKSMEDRSIDSDILNQMISFMEKINGLYFQGKLNHSNVDAFRSHPSWQLWKEYGRDTFWESYVKSMFKDCEQ